jgi:hypothetical protein
MLALEAMSDRNEVSIERGLEAPALVALLARWSEARASADGATLRELERGFEAHRAKLFLENATLQAERPDDAEASARIESNQLGIKACTVALGEVRESLLTR